MKHVKYIGAIGLLSLSLAMPSCNEEVTNDEIAASMDKLEDRIEALETLKDNIDNLVTLLNASANNYLISSVSEDEFGNITISFANGSNIVFRNGSSGSIPEVGVQADENGNLCWTVNGNFIKVDGNKVQAQPVNKIPQFKFENNIWKYSFDGSTWIDVPGGDFSKNNFSYEDKGDYYTFTVGNNGTGINVGKYKEFGVVFISTNANNGKEFQVGDDDTSITLNYSITGIDDVSSHLAMAIAPSGFTASINKDDRTITVTKSGGAWDDSVLTIIVGDGAQQTIVKRVTFVTSTPTDAGSAPTVSEGEGSNTLTLSTDAGMQQTLTVSSDLGTEEMSVLIPSEAQSWISVNSKSEIKSRTTIQNYKLLLNIAPNYTTIERVAKIRIAAGTNALEFKIKQPAGTAVTTDVFSYVFEGDESVVLRPSLEEYISSFPGLVEGKTKMKFSSNSVVTSGQFGELTQLLRPDAMLDHIKELDLTGLTNVTSIGWFNKVNLEKIVLPENIERLSQFSDSKYNEFIVPATVKYIGHEFLSNNPQLQKVVFKGLCGLRADESRLSVRSFKNCSKLVTVIIEAPLNGSKVPPAGEDLIDYNKCFNGVHPDCTLYVPADDVTAYKNSDWAELFPGEKIKSIE